MKCHVRTPSKLEMQLHAEIRSTYKSRLLQISTFIHPVYAADTPIPSQLPRYVERPKGESRRGT